MWQTWERVHEELGQDGLMLRYPHGRDDGLPPGEGAFGLCSFWAAEYLGRAGKVDAAEDLFAELCGRSNDLGLFAEEIDLRDGSALGNFPQAFTHVGLVGAALAIAEARGTRRESGLAGREERRQPERMSETRHADDLHVVEGT
jgi:GH15 family glucan-1,4-alpha-glucosidase